MKANDEMPSRDAEGYLVEPAEWNEAVAERLAGELGIRLDDDHWRVIRRVRELYEENQIIPDARHIIRYLDQRYPGMGRKRLFELFPYGYPAQACKVGRTRHAAVAGQFPAQRPAPAADGQHGSPGRPHGLSAPGKLIACR